VSVRSKTKEDEKQTTAGDDGDEVSSKSKKEKVNESLGKIGKGVGILFIGTIIGTIIGFLTRIFIIRNITQAEYGIYSLGFTILSIAVSVGLLGMNVGVTREISTYLKKDKSKVGKIVGSSLIISILTGLAISISIFIFAEPISIWVFNEPDFVLPLKFFSGAILLQVVLRMFISFFRGYDRTKEKVYFQDFSRPVAFIIFLGIFYFLDRFTLINVIISYIASILFSVILLSFYTYKSKIDWEVKGFNIRVSKSLLKFSIPLLGVAILAFIIHWTDTLMLGYFETSDIVGLYGGIYPLSRYMIMSLYLFSFIYMPIASKLHAEGLIEETKRVFRIIAKWMFLIVSPVFFLLFLFPGEVLELLFGVEYRPAATALRILIVGFMFHSLVGLTARNLVAIGKTKLSLYGSVLGATVNVVLNATLIPLWSLEGAAVASTSAFISLNIFKTWMLYKASGIHAFYNNYLKAIGIFIFLILIFFPISYYYTLGYIAIGITLIAFIGIFSSLILISKTFDNEDIDMFLKVEERTGINLKILKSFLKRFL